MAYEPTNWKTGDIITADKMRNLEAGVSNNDTNIASVVANAATTAELDVVSNEVADLATMVDNNTTKITSLQTKTNICITFPDYTQASYLNLPDKIGPTDATATVPSNGFCFLTIRKGTVGNTIYIAVNNQNIFTISNTGDTEVVLPQFIVSAGDTIKIHTDVTSTDQNNWFTIASKIFIACKS